MSHRSLLFVCFLLGVCLLVAFGVPRIKTFSHAISSAKLNHTETELYSYTTAESSAAITHWWYTGGPDIKEVILRFYVDGESVPSIELSLDLGVGIGFGDTSAPWGTQKIGKGAKTGGVFNNIRIPFQKSIRITGQQPVRKPEGTFYFIVRGAEGVPISIGNIEIPSYSKLRLVKIVNETYQPLEKVNVLDLQGHKGALMMWTLAVASGDYNFLEGCVRVYIDGGDKMLLSSGTEDYFDSAYYFNAGMFHLPVSGLTHDSSKGGKAVTLSAYRFHQEDPVFWENDIKLVWRNGDTVAKNGQKCIDDNGAVVGNPTKSVVTTYAWVYEWD